MTGEEKFQVDLEVLPRHKERLDRRRSRRDERHHRQRRA